MDTNTILKKENIPFTQVPNVIIYDEKLSAQAKGVACYLFSRPDGWHFNYIEIASHFKNSEDTIRKLLKELEDAGYLTREKIREGGKFARVEYRLSFTNLAKTNLVKTKIGETEFGFLGTNNTECSNTEYNNTDSNTPYNPPKGEKANTSSVLANTVKELFNTICVSLPKVQRMNASRISHVKNRLKEAEVAPKDCEAYLRKFFASVEASDFLTNRNGDNRQNWKASFDWLFLPRNFLKVSEGNYTNKQSLKFDKAPAGWLGTYMKIYQTGKLPSSWDELTQDKKENIINFGKR